jgi:hypothetical protein
MSEEVTSNQLLESLCSKTISSSRSGICSNIGRIPFINIAGLAVGMACCILILLYVRDELRYDRFHENAERIYRLTLSTEEDGQPTNANTSFGQGPALAAEFPEVEAVIRFRIIRISNSISWLHSRAKRISP